MAEPSEVRATFAAIIAELIRRNRSGAPGSPYSFSAIDIDPRRAGVRGVRTDLYVELPDERSQP